MTKQSRVYNMNYRELGYDKYDEYLNGKEWKEIKNYFYKLSSPYRCRLCWSKKNLLVHKRSYYYLQLKDLQKLDDKMLHKVLVYLCKGCNHKIHFKKNKKVPLDYLYLWEREKQVYRSTLVTAKRVFRAFIHALVILYRLYRLHPFVKVKR